MFCLICFPFSLENFLFFLFHLFLSFFDNDVDSTFFSFYEISCAKKHANHFNTCSNAKKRWTGWIRFFFIFFFHFAFVGLGMKFVKRDVYMFLFFFSHTNIIAYSSTFSTFLFRVLCFILGFNIVLCMNRVCVVVFHCFFRIPNSNSNRT